MFMLALPKTSFVCFIDTREQILRLFLSSCLPISFFSQRFALPQQTKTNSVAPSLAKQYGPVPVVGVGHSCGALLHMLITSLFPDTPRAANALISYNNRGVGEAVPLFDELVVPLFSDKERNGSELMKALLKVAREKSSGKNTRLRAISLFVL